MTTATNEACIGWLIENAIWCERNDTFDSGRHISIKGDFLDGGNK